MNTVQSLIRRVLEAVSESLDDVEEDYRLNVVECNPYEGTPPVTLEEYRLNLRKRCREDEEGWPHLVEEKEETP